MTILTLLPFFNLSSNALYWLNPRRSQRPRKPVDIHSCQTLGIQNMVEKSESESFGINRYIAQQYSEEKIKCH